MDSAGLFISPSLPFQLCWSFSSGWFNCSEFKSSPHSRGSGSTGQEGLEAGHLAAITEACLPHTPLYLGHQRTGRSNRKEKISASCVPCLTAVLSRASELSRELLKKTDIWTLPQIFNYWLQAGPWLQISKSPRVIPTSSRTGKHRFSPSSKG